MGWTLLDRELIEAISCAGHVDTKVVRRFDERADSWLGRVNRQAMRGAALAAGVVPDDASCFDPEVMTGLTRQIVEQAYVEGGCVIVGRGAQCILQRKPDAFHVFVYAPFRDRVHRLRSRLGPGFNIEQRIDAVDAERAHYLHQRFGKEWDDPHLYNLMISSGEDEDSAARVILYAMTERE